MLNYSNRQINNLKFSLREIDIISCVLNMRGAKKIANILQISHRTVERHIQNIMLKVGCNSQDGITDFIEKSTQLLQLKKHYTLLLINSFFQNQLIKISPHVKKKKLSYGIDLIKDCRQEAKILEKHMSLLGINFSDQDTNFSIKLSHEDGADVNSSGLYNISIENYYSDFFQMLVLLFPEMNFTAAINEFKLLEENAEEVKNDIEQRIITNLQNEVELASPTKDAKKSKAVNLNAYNYKIAVFIIGIFLLIGVIVKYYSVSLDNKKLITAISSSLSLPHRSNTLNRSSISTKIFDIIQNSKEKITTIALTGVGGAGKTTAAKQFAIDYSADIIWELNINSEDSLLSSYEELVQELCNNDDCSKEIASIQNQNSTHKKLKRYQSIIARYFNNHNKWLLIYDNFEVDSPLATYLPNNHKIWGNGVVIITTRDTDISNQNYIDENNVIEVGKLDANEKHELFTKLLSQKIEHSEKLKQFLEYIPPYPLDILLASNYINKHNTNFNEYLNKISNHAGDSFSNNDISQDIGRYSNTRYAIVATSIKKIIDNNPEFKEYILHLGLVDSSLMQASYPEYEEDNNTLRKFINCMLSHSLLQTNDEQLSDDTIYTVHKTTQRIILDYMLTNLDDIELDSYIKKVTQKFSAYTAEAIQHDNIAAIKGLVSHAESLYDNMMRYFPSYEPSAAISLASCYFYLGNNKRAATLLEQYADKFDVQTLDGRQATVNSQIILGNVYSNIGQYDKANKVFNKAISLILSDSNNVTLLAWSKVNLARLYIKLGKYDDAKHLLSDAFEVYKDHYGIDSPDTSWVMSYYGNILVEIGEFEKSERLLLASHNIVEKHYGSNHIRSAITLIDLAHLYIHTGNYHKARQLLADSKKIHDNFFDEQSPNSSWLIFNLGLLYGKMGMIHEGIEYLNKSYANHLEHHANDYVTKRDLVELASLYADVGNYDKAKSLLDKSIEEYKKQFGASHNKVAELYNKYAQVCLGNSELERALDFIRKSLAIFKKNNHPQSYISYENLADYYLKNYNNQAAIRYLEKAEQILRAHYPIDSELTKNIIEKKKKILALI